MSPVFFPVKEHQVTRAIVRKFWKEFDDYVESDVIIIGSGPAGLVCGHDLAKQGKKVLILEQTCHLGGGFWSGGYLMNHATLREPSHKLMEEFGVPTETVDQVEGLHTVNALHAVSALMKKAFDAGVRVFNLTEVVDLVVRQDGELAGVVINWWPLEQLPHHAAHVDPVPLECKVLVDATGHDAAALHMLQKRGFIKEPIPGNGAMWIDQSEEEIMKKTGEFYPNLFMVGLSVAAAYGTPRMGPAFGSMLLSGRVGAEKILAKLESLPKSSFPT